jgi:predicted NACHT family NTPase
MNMGRQRVAVHLPCVMQEELPKEFLTKLSHEYGLTSLEEVAFIETFSRETAIPVILKTLNISLSAYKTRMGNIYAKFSFRDGGRGKRNRLLYFLHDRYRKETPQGSLRLSEVSVDILVDELNDRIKDKIRNECGSMRVLDMTSPLELSSIFTEVNILEGVAGKQRLHIDDLLREFHSGNDLNEFEHFAFHSSSTEKVSGIDYVQQQDKLLVLGKPGAGKTTFLKHIALQCCDRKILPNYLPVFVALKAFADRAESISLLDYIIQDLGSWDIHDYEIEGLLKERRILLLLDGLDEVRGRDLHNVNQQIQSFTDNFHGNRFIVTCRLAAQEYVFEKFTEVEVADFNEHQIESFSRNWFFHKETPEKAERLLERLHQNPRIQELATNPLLLTLLCLVFEAQSDFPASRAELYEDGVNTLLRKWDASRNIERGQIYQELSVSRKIGLLSHIAIQAFERSAIFLRKQTLSGWIAGYIVNLPIRRRRRISAYEVDLQGEVILKSIEAQHGLLVERAYGIYSFSHLSFQEYFAAKAIASEHELEKFQPVFERVRDKQWSEVFLLAVSMSSKADILMKIMKQKTDQILLGNPKFIDFLDWVDQKSATIAAKISPAFVRAFYFIYSLSQKEEVVSLLNATPIHPDMDMDRSLIFLLNSLSRLSELPTGSAELSTLRDKAKEDIQKFNYMLITLLDAEENPFLIDLREHMRVLSGVLQSEAGAQWIDDLRAEVFELRDFLISRRDVAHDWGFQASEIKILREYYNANQLCSIVSTVIAM